MNINITQYIEEIVFIGKRGFSRPIKVELRNKRLRKRILQNSAYFRDVDVSEYLSESELRDGRELKKKLQNAIIRNNKLIIKVESLLNSTKVVDCLIQGMILHLWDPELKRA